MWIALILPATLLAWRILYRHEIYFEKKIVAAVFLLELIGVLLYGYDMWQQTHFDGAVRRPAAGAGDRTDTFFVTSDSFEEEIEMTVSAVKKTDKEAETLIDQAVAEIDATFLLGNKDLDHIEGDVLMRETYVNGAVSALWRLDDYTHIDAQGHLDVNGLEENCIVTAFCELTAGEVQYTYSFAFVVPVPNIETSQGYRYYLEEALNEANQKEDTKEMVYLPQTLKGKELTWQTLPNHRGLLVAVFGLILALGRKLSQRENNIQDRRRYERELEKDYPDIVSNLSLYIGAGVSVKMALKKMASNYLDQRSKYHLKKRVGFEEIIILNHEMDDGKGELEAYKQFGKRLGHKKYRKLSLILVQNLRKGNERLLEQLEKEERLAFDERKVRARVAGEEASTKLLAPMFGLLMIVLIVLIYPAVQGFRV